MVERNKSMLARRKPREKAAIPMHCTPTLWFCKEQINNSPRAYETATEFSQLAVHQCRWYIVPSHNDHWINRVTTSPIDEFFYAV